MNDRELIERCRVGDGEARRELYERTSNRVFRLLFRMTGNREDALDLAQETYVKGFQRFDQFDGRAAVESWVFKIAVNEALQFRRRKKVAETKLHSLASHRTLEVRPVDPALRLDLEEYLAGLSPDDRILLLLRYQEGFDYRHMADILGCAEGTIASRLNRARNRLRENLQKTSG